MPTSGPHSGAPKANPEPGRHLASSRLPGSGSPLRSVRNEGSLAGPYQRRALFLVTHPGGRRHNPTASTPASTDISTPELRSNILSAPGRRNSGAQARPQKA